MFTYHLDVQGVVLDVASRCERGNWLRFRASCFSATRLLLVNDFLSVRLAELLSLRCAGAEPGPGFAGCRTSAAGLQFQRVPLGATTIQTIINHRPTPPRLLVKPNTIKKSPQGPNLPGYVNDFLVKVVETPSLGTFKTPLQKALAISVLGIILCWEKDQIKRTLLFWTARPAWITMGKGMMTS